jgi:phospholipid transport system substrate-binding protein
MRMSSVTLCQFSRRWFNACVAGIVLAGFAPVGAAGQSGDPAARIDGLYGVLLDTMRQAKQLGVKGRYEKLAPILYKTYDLPGMSRVAVGQSWDALQPSQQAALTDAFSRMTIATYASRFDDFSGERFEVLQTVDQPGGAKLVKTQIVQSNGKTVVLNYLMRGGDSEWRIVDVYLDGTISELASRRSEFSAILKSGGPDALISSLRQKGDKLLAGS